MPKMVIITLRDFICCFGEIIMKIIISFLLSIFLFFSDIKVVNAESNIYARCYIVMDANTNEVLEGHNENEIRSVASISKIMTAIIALESDKLFDIVTIGEEVLDAVGSSIYLNVGEQITIIDLVYGLLLRSGNDCAVSIAINVSGSIEKFVDKMNSLAYKLGMKNTIFSNPSGLDIVDNGNNSTCLDMALLMAYCLKNDLFCEIINTRKYRSLDRVFINKNKLLKNYEHLIGGKTGYTYKAKRTLINSALKDKQKLIVCTFDCGSDFSFHKQKFEKYFNEYNYFHLLDKGENYIESYLIVTAFDIGVRMNKDIDLYGVMIYRILKGSDVLEIIYCDNNQNQYELGKYEIVSFKKIE